MFITSLIQLKNILYRPWDSLGVCVLCNVFRCPLCQLFHVHALKCSTCQSMLGANRQVSWGRELGEQECGGALKVFCVLRCVCFR